MVSAGQGTPPQALPRQPKAGRGDERLYGELLTIATPRRIHPYGIHFQAVRYLDTTLAAYAGEDVIIRYDPRDMAEQRVYFHDEFVCRAINPELAGETIALKDIIRARNYRRRELRATLAERQTTVEALLGLRRGGEARPPLAEVEPPGPPAHPERPRLKRYYNE